MSGKFAFRKIMAISFGLFVFLVFSPNLSPPALAADNSSGSATYDDYDCSKGFSIGHPQDAWRGVDMIYFREYIYNVFFKPYNWENPDQVVTLRIYRKPVAGAPEKCPDHIGLPEGTQTYANSDRRHSAVRFAVFKDKLRLFYAKTYDGDTGYILWVRTSPDGENWPDDNSKNLWENRHKDPDNPLTIKGLVAKVMNDVLYVLIQAKNTHDLYLITTADGETYTAPRKIATLPGNDCLLNGDVFMRGSDTQPLLAFVTKDDVYGGGDATGASSLYVFDPADSSVTHVTTLPDKWKDLAVVQGNVYNCTPYSLGALQIWGLKMDHDNVYHMQFVFNPDGRTGAFNPAGYIDTGKDCSGHVDNSFRGYIAACSAPEEVADGDLVDLQSYDWVWWWGSTDISNGYGRSLKYRADYMKNLGPQGDHTNPDAGDENSVNDAWVLLGVLTGLPPYYPNGVAREQLENFYKVSYGIQNQIEVSTSVTSEKSVSIGYKSEFFKGKASSGFSCSYAVEDTTGNQKTTTAEQTLEFDPSHITSGTGIDNGAQAWGIFLAPYIVSDRYQLYAPDRSSNLGPTFYYTYIGDDSSIVGQVFDMTNAVNPVNDPFWHGFPALPNSLDYKAWQDDAIAIASTGTTDYATLLSKQIYCNNCSEDFKFSQTVSVENDRKSTNTVSFSAGMFGFESELEDSLTMFSSNKTSLGQNIIVHYGVPGFEETVPPPDDYNSYLKSMNMNMYLLNAKTPDAFWIPDGAKTESRTHSPWCLTWHVISAPSVGTSTLQVGGSETHGSVAGALRANPEVTNAEIRITSDITEKEEILIAAGMSVSAKGADATLDARGNPTVTVTTLGVTVEAGGSLHLENLVIDAANAGAMMSAGGNLSLRNCSIRGNGNGDGIILDDGTLSMDRIRLFKSGGDGIRIIRGSASLINCALTGNARNGLNIEGGTVTLEHCTLLQNGGSDFSASASAVSTATNSVMGSVSPEARISRLMNGLVETLPESAVIDAQQDTLLNTGSRIIVENGELKEIPQDSPCVDKGTPSAVAPLDIAGNYRDPKPDMGALEYYRPMEIVSIDTLTLTIMGNDPATASDSLRLVLDIDVPADFSLAEDVRYAISFGNHLIDSDAFDAISAGEHSLLFSMDSGTSTLGMELSSDRKRLKMSLELSDAKLYQDISQYLQEAKDAAPNGDASTIHMPIRAAAGNYQTGEVWMSFTFETKDGIGTGSNPRLTSSEPEKADDYDDGDDTCFISTVF